MTGFSEYCGTMEQNTRVIRARAVKSLINLYIYAIGDSNDFRRTYLLVPNLSPEFK